ETLLNPDRNRGYRYFQTQLLKLYFLTTLYVDVKEPAVLHISATKKTQSCTDDNFLSENHAGTKLSSNLQSQMYVERTPRLEESRFQRDQ
ncbi:MAG TPA: hypothetical protein VK555_06690, partial [Terriglobales bacterium]|nr:hypothetical protein [Terriglobales bacterium]